MQVSEFVTSLVERGVLTFHTNDEGWLTYRVDQQKYLIHQNIDESWLDVYEMAISESIATSGEYGLWIESIESSHFIQMGDDVDVSKFKLLKITEVAI